MSDSPYKSPESDDSSAPVTASQSVYHVAKYQRWVMFALLAIIATNIISVVTMQLAPALQIGILMLNLVVVLFAMASVFLLAKEVVGAGVGILCAIFMIAPCISLLILLVINQRATKYLESHGIKVGFLGVDPNTL